MLIKIIEDILNQLNNLSKLLEKKKIMIKIKELILMQMELKI